MKRIILLLLAISFLLVGCGSATDVPAAEANTREQTSMKEPPVMDAEDETPEETESTESTEPTEPAVTIYPLPDDTMDNLSDVILSISLEEGGAYVDDAGEMQMDLNIYSHDVYDMVDISMLKVGDILVTNAGEVEVTSLERIDDSSIAINGGLTEDGLDLVTDDRGIFYAIGLDDTKNWYEIGEATIRVSADFVYHDYSDLEQGETVFYAGSFLNGEVTDYDFTPYNTTVRVENGQIVEMIRVYVP